MRPKKFWKNKLLISSLLVIFSIGLAWMIVCESQQPETMDLNNATVITGMGGWIPSQYSDTTESGRSAATKDIKSGKALVAIYGDIEELDVIIDEYKRFNLKPVYMGGPRGGKGSNFWAGYNEEVYIYLLEKYNHKIFVYRERSEERRSLK